MKILSRVRIAVAIAAIGASPLVTAAEAAAAADADSATAWAQDGRPLPEPEFLQPRLDDKLPTYTRCASATLSGKIEGSAPAILPKLVARWLSAFHAFYPELKVSVPPPYLGPQGSLSPPLRKFLDGHSDFGFISRDMAGADVAEFRRVHGFDPLMIPVAAGAFRHFGFLDSVAVIVNQENPVQHLSFAQLDAALSKTHVRGAKPAVTWGDLGVAEWAEQPIHVVGAAAWNGEESARATVMRERVLSVPGNPGQWRSDLPSQGTEADVPKDVAADRYAIGFTGMGHLPKGAKAVAIAESDNGPFYDPSYENVARAQYPLSRVVYIALAKKPGQPVAPALAEFVRFLLSKQGQQIVLDQGILLPLRAPQVDASLHLLEQDAQTSRCKRGAAKASGAAL